MFEDAMHIAGFNVRNEGVKVEVKVEERNDFSL